MKTTIIIVILLLILLSMLGVDVVSVSAAVTGIFVVVLCLLLFTVSFSDKKQNP